MRDELSVLLLVLVIVILSGFSGGCDVTYEEEQEMATKVASQMSQWRTEKGRLHRSVGQAEKALATGCTSRCKLAGVLPISRSELKLQKERDEARIAELDNILQTANGN